MIPHLLLPEYDVHEHEAEDEAGQGEDQIIESFVYTQCREVLFLSCSHKEPWKLACSLLSIYNVPCAVLNHYDTLCQG